MTPTATRRRSKADTRERLLQAASELFAERGFDHTTVREVGQRAEVDPALIARYFGSKSELYLAALQRDGQPARVAPLDLADPEAVRGLLDRVGPRGPTPTLYAAIRPHEDPALQAAAMDLLDHRILAPARDQALAAEVADPQLRAEIAAAALAGVIISRTSAALPTLNAASSDQVAALVTQLLAGLLDH